MSPPVLAAWLAERFGADFAAELLAEFRSAGRARVDEARDAALRGDAATVERAAHTLGSMALTVGFDELGALCRAMEARVRSAGLEGAELAPLAAAFDLAAARAEELEEEGILAAAGIDRR